MNYTVYKALNNLAGANTTFTANLAQIGTAIDAVDSNFNQTNVQDIWTQLQGAFNGWFCNETHQGDGTYATTVAALTLATSVTCVQTSQWHGELSVSSALGPQRGQRHPAHHGDDDRCIRQDHLSGPRQCHVPATSAVSLSSGLAPQ